MKTYIFRFTIKEEEDGRWSAWVPSLPGCTSWGNTKEEAVVNIQDATRAYLETLLEEGRDLPPERDALHIIEEPALTVTM